MSKLFICLSFFLSISTCQNSVENAALYQHWVHSYEEEDGTGKVYRTSDYNFPLSRGRHGFQLQENGTCMEYAIARGDGTETRKAKWEFEAKDVVKVTYPTEDRTPLRYRIISVDTSMLKIEILSN